MDTDLDNRLRSYLRQLSERDWGSPTGFGGRSCFQAIPAGLDAEEAASSGLHPGRQRDYTFFQGAGQRNHHLVVEADYVYYRGEAHERFCKSDTYVDQ